MHTMGTRNKHGTDVAWSVWEQFRGAKSQGISFSRWPTPSRNSVNSRNGDSSNYFHDSRQHRPSRWTITKMEINLKLADTPCGRYTHMHSGRSPLPSTSTPQISKVLWVIISAEPSILEFIGHHRSSFIGFLPSLHLSLHTTHTHIHLFALKIHRTQKPDNWMAVAPGFINYQVKDKQYISLWADRCTWGYNIQCWLAYYVHSLKLYFSDNGEGNNTTSERRFECFGSLISVKDVQSAAHNVEEPWPTEIWQHPIFWQLLNTQTYW